MPTALWVLVALIFIPYILAPLGGYARVKELGGLDNHQPRTQATQLTGFGARAVAAQANAWEALGFYTACIVVAHMAGVTWEALSGAALVVLAARVLHAVTYLMDIALARSVIQLVGLGGGIYMIYLAA